MVGFSRSKFRDKRVHLRLPRQHEVRRGGAGRRTDAFESAEIAEATSPEDDSTLTGRLASLLSSSRSFGEFSLGMRTLVGEVVPLRSFPQSPEASGAFGPISPICRSPVPPFPPRIGVEGQPRSGVRSPYTAGSRRGPSAATPAAPALSHGLSAWATRFGEPVTLHAGMMFY
jgi:hypothetical protein